MADNIDGQPDHVLHITEDTTNVGMSNCYRVPKLCPKLPIRTRKNKGAIIKGSLICCGQVRGDAIVPYSVQVLGPSQYCLSKPVQWATV